MQNFLSIAFLAGLTASVGMVSAQNQEERLKALQEQIDALEAQIKNIQDGEIICFPMGVSFW